MESSLARAQSLRAAGDSEGAVLFLRQRIAQGPYSGYAWFLLGELAYEAQAYPTAVTHYRKAVETDPSVGDREGAFASGAVIADRLDTLLAGPWAQDRPPEVRDLYYLKRRLAGGCE